MARRRRPLRSRPAVALFTLHAAGRRRPRPPAAVRTSPPGCGGI